MFDNIEPEESSGDVSFQELENSVKECALNIAALEKFRSHIHEGKECGIFDAEDLKWVDDELTEKRAHYQDMNNELRNKRYLYDNSITKLEQVLNDRKIIIEAAENETNVLQNNPTLLQLFARKNAQLIQMLEHAKDDFNK